MLELKKIAITGGISSGKSLVCQFLSDLGSYVVDADKIVHQLLTPHTNLGNKVIELLGDEIVSNGVIDRTRVARKVFLNPKLLRSLEKLIHPKVYEEIEKQYKEICQRDTLFLLFVAEIPLLFETAGEKYFNQTVAVIADTETSWERYRKETGHEREDFNRRRARQLRQSEKAKKANFVITNNGTPEDLKKEVDALFSRLCGERIKKHN